MKCIAVQILRKHVEICRDVFVWRVNLRQERQCTSNVILMRLCEIIVAVEKQYVLHILSACL